MGWSSTDIPDQSGRVAVVTGANGGLGLETVRELVRKAAHVVMAVRNQQKAQEAVREIRASISDAAVELFSLDLGSQASVKEAVSPMPFAPSALARWSNSSSIRRRRGLGGRR